MSRDKRNDDYYYYEESQQRNRKRSSAQQTRPSGKKKLSRKARKRRRNRRIIFAVESVLLLIVIAGLFVVSKFDLIQKGGFGKKDVQINNDLNEEVVETMKGYTTIAIFGVDGTGGTNEDGGRSMTLKSGQSDVIVLANINNETGEIKLVSVYRDTYLNINDDNDYFKINSAYNQGGPKQALEALNKNLDLTVTNYVAVNWYAVARAIDLMGGVDVDVPDYFLPVINGYIMETKKGVGYDALGIFESGYQHLSGIQAVAFARIRHTVNDYGRTDNQRLIFSLLFEKAKQMDLKTLLEITDEVFPYVETNLTLAQIGTMMTNVGKYEMTESKGFPFVLETTSSSSAIGTDAVVAKNLVDNVVQLHQMLYDNQSYVPSETVMKISNWIESQTGIYPDPE